MQQNTNPMRFADIVLALMISRKRQFEVEFGRR